MGLSVIKIQLTAELYDIHTQTFFYSKENASVAIDYTYSDKYTQILEWKNI